MTERKRKSLPECIRQIDEAYASIEDAVRNMVGMECHITVTALDGRVMMQSVDKRRPN